MKRTKSIISVLLILMMIFSLVGCSTAKKPAQAEAKQESKGKIAFVPFAVGVPYFKAGADGAVKAGEALGYEVVVKGPSNADSAAQIQIINDLVNQGDVKAIVAACMDSSSVVPALKKAREAGIKVVTWDLDCEADGRDYYAGLMNLDLIGNEWIDSMVRSVGDSGEYAIVTATLTNEFMNKRVENMKKYAAEKYPNLKLLTVQACDADPQKAYQIVKDLITKYPNIKCIATVSTEAYSSAAKVIEDEGKIGKIYVVGGITPNLAKSAFESGAAKESVLWDPGKWAGFAVTTAAQIVEGKKFDKIGNVEIPGYPKAELVSPDTLFYHEMLTFTPENVNNYDF